MPPAAILLIFRVLLPQAAFLKSFGTGMLLDHGSQWRGVAQEALWALLVLWALERIGLKDGGAPPALACTIAANHSSSANPPSAGQAARRWLSVSVLLEKRPHYDHNFAV